MNPLRNEENRYTHNPNYQFVVWSDISPIFLYFPVPVQLVFFIINEDRQCGASFTYIGEINIYEIKFILS